MSGDSLRERLFRAFTISLALVILVGGLVAVWPTYMRSRALSRQQADLSARIEEKKLRIAELQELQRRFQTDSDLVEAIARRNGRIFPGELVFIFDDGKPR